MEKPYLIPCWFNYLSSSISQLHWAAASISHKTVKKTSVKTLLCHPRHSVWLLHPASPLLHPASPSKLHNRWIWVKPLRAWTSLLQLQNYLHDNTDMKDTEIALVLKQIHQVKTKDYVLTLTTTQCTVLCHSQTHPVPQYCCHLWHLRSENPLSN